jgi:protein involved in sex pheromone biosynthesis
MNEIKLSKEEIGKKLKDVLHFDDDFTFNKTVEGLSEGYSVVLDAVAYIGNGRCVDRNKKKRYQYKMIVPILTDHGQFYSTDLFEKSSKNAIDGSYALYQHTRQLAVGIVGVVDTVYSPERFEFCYRDGKYGFNKLVS